MLFIATSRVGGAERMSMLYAKILQNHGYSCSVLCIKKDSVEYQLKSLIPEGVDSHVISYKSRNGKITDVRLAFFLLRHHYDIIFTCNPNDALRLVKLKRYGILHSKIVFRDKLMPEDHASDIGKRLAGWMDLCIAQTPEMKTQMMSVYGMSDDEIKVVYNPIDKNKIQKEIIEEYPFDKSYINFVASNRVVPQKDVLTMLKAFCVFHEDRPKSRLYVLGYVYNEDYKKTLDDFITKHSLSDCVFFEGQQSNPFKYVAYCDAFLLSSIYEGLPNGMLEAMYLGIPVVVTRSIPYIAQTVKDGVNGYTAEVGNHIEFANGMKKAIELQNLPKFNDINNSENYICNLFDSLKA